MKHPSFYPILLISVFFSQATAQNLVPNPSFEEYEDCPMSTAELHSQLTSWYSFGGSPDFFHSCNNAGLGSAGVPNNGWGNQDAISGDGYAGVITFAHFSENNREYMACPLNEPLIIGEEYYVSFYISLYDGGVFSDWHCAANRFGLKFFLDPNYLPEPLESTYQPQNMADIEYNVMFTDTFNWTLVEGWFIADQAYNWLAIGNFYTDENTDTLQMGNPENTLHECIVIIYVENVCVALNSDDCQVLLSTNIRYSHHQVSVFPNPSSRYLHIESESIAIVNIRIFDISGKQIFIETGRSLSKAILIENWAKGIYFLHIRLDDDSLTTHKIIKS